jgi:hypothetical protein
MAHSAFEYVRNFEEHEVCLPDTWIVVSLGNSVTKADVLLQSLDF